MAISYNNLWKTLIDKGINKSELCKKVKISTSTMAKMTNLSILFQHATLDTVACRKPYPDRRISAYGWILSAGLRPGHPFFKSFPARFSQKKAFRLAGTYPASDL